MSSSNSKVILSGDCIALFIDPYGFISVPSNSEPIPEKHEIVSHLRVAPGDFSIQPDPLRSMFRIDSELSQKSDIVFGSVVRLTHVATGMVLVAGDADDNMGTGGSIGCIFLKNDVPTNQDLSKKWIIVPRYKLRDDGDPVRINDIILLRSVLHRDLFFGLNEKSTLVDVEHLIGLRSESDDLDFPGIQVGRFLTKPISLSHDLKNDNVEKSSASFHDLKVVKTGDLLRIFHRESNAHLICRLEDNMEMTSDISPLGTVFRKLNEPKSYTSCVVARPLEAQTPKMQYDFDPASTALGIWQILPVDNFNDSNIFGKLKYNSAIRFRHLISEQYLSIRISTVSDSMLTTQHATKDVTGIYYVVAGSAYPDDSTVFMVRSVDVAVTENSDDETNDVLYSTNIYFEHKQTKYGFMVNRKSKNASMESTTNTSDKTSTSKINTMKKTWWEYAADIPVKMARSHGTVRYADVVQFLPVSSEEVQDVLFCLRYLPLVRAVITVIQLTPTTHDLYLPFFRHFHSALQTMTLWLLGVYTNDSTLADIETNIEEARNLSTSDIPQNNKIEKIMTSSNLIKQMSVFQKSNSKEKSDKLTTQKSRHLSVNRQVSKKNYKMSKQQVMTSILKKSQEAYPNPEKKQNFSSLAPWLGRSTSHYSQTKESNRVENMDILSLLQEVINGNIPYSSITYRRQGIVADLRLLELLMHFLDVVAILQRGFQLAIDNTTTESASLMHPNKPSPTTLSSIPSIIIQCCHQTQDVLHAQVVRNEKIALKMISIQGSLLAFISQKVLGWNSPIELILKLTCSTKDSASASANEFIFNQTVGFDGNNSVLMQTENILVNSVSSSDLRKIVQQMYELYLENNSKAVKILSLLSLLCSSGKASKYFQNIVTSCIFKNVSQHDPSIVQKLDEERPSALQEECLLFHTNHDDATNQWFVKFGCPYEFGSHNEDNSDFVDIIRREESFNLSHFFQYYLLRDASSATVKKSLGPQKVFEMLEDLGFSNKFLYDETAMLIDSNHIDFIQWWADRGLHFRPTTCSSLAGISRQDILRHLKLFSETNSTIKKVHDESKMSKLELQKKLNMNVLIRSRVRGLNIVLKVHEPLAHDLENLSSVTVAKSSSDFAFKNPMLFKSLSNRALAPLHADTPNRAETKSPKEFTSSLYHIFSSQNKRYEEFKSSNNRNGSSKSPILGKRVSMVVQNQRSGSKRKNLMIRSMYSFSSHDGGSDSPDDDFQHYDSDDDIEDDVRLQRVDSEDKSESFEEINDLEPLFQIPKNNEWVEVHKALSFKYSEYEWFRLSLLLLIGMCKGKNTFAQRIASIIFPAECLIDLLTKTDGSIEDNNRAIICDLLCVIYIENDLVFASRVTPTRSLNLYVGYDEEIYNSSLGMSKAFNSISRVRYAGCSDGSALRTLLFKYIRFEFSSALSLYSPEKHKMLYTEAFLCLFRQLIQVGFFNEPLFEFFNSQNLSLQAPSAISFGTGGLDQALFGSDNVQDVFNLDSMVEILQVKLLETIEYHRMHGYDEVVEQSAAQSRSVKIPTFPSKSKSDVLRNGSHHNSFDLSREDFNLHEAVEFKTLKNFRFSYVQSNRVTFEHIDDALNYFDLIFTDTVYISVIKNVITILLDIYNSQQIMRVQKIWDNICTNAKVINIQSYKSTTLEDRIKRKSEEVGSLVASFFVESNTDTLVKSILTATLHKDIDIQRTAYALIDDQLCLEKGALEIFATAEFMFDRQQSFAYRFVDSLSSNLFTYLMETFSQPSPPKLYLIEKLNFTLQSIKNLSFKLFDSKLHAINVSQIKKKGANTREPHYLDNQSQFLFFASEDIPCPIGHDDFFELDLVKLMGNEQEIASFFEYYRLDDSEADENLRPPLLDCHKVMSNIAPKLLDAIVNHVEMQQKSYLLMHGTASTKNKNTTTSIVYGKWESRTPAERYVFNKLFAFLCAMASHSSSLSKLCAENTKFVNLLLAYVPDSLGAIRLLCTIIKQSGDEIIKNDSGFVSLLYGRFISFQNHAEHSLLVSVLLCSMMESTGQHIVETGRTFFLEHFELFAADMNNLLALDGMNVLDNLVGNVTQRIELCNIIKPISLLCAQCNEVEAETVLFHNVQAAFPEDLCAKLLSSSFTPLIVKLQLLPIGLKLYQKPTQINILEILLIELRKMRLFFALEIHGNLQFEQSNFCIEFIQNGVLPIIEYYLYSSGLLSVAILREKIFSEISDVESECISPFIAEKINPRYLEKFGSNDDDLPNHAIVPMKRVTLEKPSIPDELITCFMLVLNIYKSGKCKLLHVLTTEQLDQLLWVSFSIKTLLLDETQFIYHNDGTPIELSEYGAVVKSVTKIAHEMVKQSILKLADEYLFTHIVDNFKGHSVEVLMKGLRDTETTKAQSIFDVIRGTAFNDEVKVFQQQMTLTAQYSSSYIRNTSIYQVLDDSLTKSAEFSELGGDILFEKSKGSYTKSKIFAQKFRNYSDFDVWVRADGALFLNIFYYLGRLSNLTDVEYNLIQMLASLLENVVEDLTNSTNLNDALKQVLIESEKSRLYQKQATLNTLGGLKFVTKVIGKIFIYLNDISNDYAWKFGPLVLMLGTKLIDGQNAKLQNYLVTLIDESIQNQLSPELNFMNGLQYLIRRSVLKLNAFSIPTSTMKDASTSDHFEDNTIEIINHIKTIVQLFRFVGAICNGENNRSQLFFSGNDKNVRNKIDIIEDLSSLADATFGFFLSIVYYIKYDQFYEKIGPFVWVTKDASKRRFFAWHNPRNNLKMLTNLVYAMTILFESMNSMCSHDVHSSIGSSLDKCCALLEFLGLMTLEATSEITVVSKFLKNDIKKQIIWKGGVPFSFYKNYIKYLNSLSLLEIDPEHDIIQSAVNQWFIDKKKNPNFETIFGLSTNAFFQIIRAAEYKCLRLLLAYLDCADSDEAYGLCSTFNYGIMMQNMDNTFKSINKFQFNQREVPRSNVVSYIALLERMALSYDSEVKDVLKIWEKACKKSGNDPRDVYGAIEIIGSNGILQRIYFTIPSFVKRFWTYPEVQKAKEAIVLEVNRSSPEEKMSDFLRRMTNIIFVMRRQEALRLLLRPPLHALFGGQTIFLSRYFPQIRRIALLLTALLNFFYAYMTSLSNQFEPASNSYLHLYRENPNYDLSLFIISLVHLSLYGILALRYIMNSTAADDLPDLYPTDNFWLKIPLGITKIGLASLYIAMDALWPLLLVFFSYLATFQGKFWFYVPCLLEVVLQFKDMYFLFQAIQRNVSKISFTMLLAFLCLYYFAVIAYLFFKVDQYDLNGHIGCSNLVSCFAMHLGYGLNNAPNWQNGDRYVDPDIPVLHSNLPVYGQLISRILGTAYNLIYTILINLVLQAIISGLIIDTFSAMRQENEAIVEDISDKCFICSIDKDVFEQAGISFFGHIRHEHNMWQYVWFKLYLDLKDPVSLSSTETYAKKNMQDPSAFVRLMPIKKSVTLEKVIGANNEESTDEKIEKLVSVLEQIKFQQVNFSKALAAIGNTQYESLRIARLQAKESGLYFTPSGDVIPSKIGKQLIYLAQKSKAKTENFQRSSMVNRDSEL